MLGAQDVQHRLRPLVTKVSTVLSPEKSPSAMLSKKLDGSIGFYLGTYYLGEGAS